MKRLIFILLAAVALLGISLLQTSCTFEISPKEITTGKDTAKVDSTKKHFKINLGHLGTLGNVLDPDSFPTSGEDDELNKLPGQIFKSFFNIFLYPLIAFIVAFALIFVTLIVFFIMRYMNKRAQYKLYEEAIRAGQKLPDNIGFPKKETNIQTQGIKNISLGIGLGIFLWILLGIEMASIGLISICTGIGQLIIYRTQQSATDKHKEE